MSTSVYNNNSEDANLKDLKTASPPASRATPSPRSRKSLQSHRYTSSSSGGRRKSDRLRFDEDESSDSDADEATRQERRFERAFQRFDPNNENQISVKDFLRFFDTLQASLPPLSDPLLSEEARDLALTFMTENHASNHVTITRQELKDFYKAFTGKTLVSGPSELTHTSPNMAIENNATVRAKDILNIKTIDPADFADKEALASVPTPQKQNRKPLGEYFQRPRHPRRGTSSVASGDYSDSEHNGARSMNDVLSESTLEITGNPLATSTPKQYSKNVRLQTGPFSPPILSPPKIGSDGGEGKGRSGLSYGSPHSRQGPGNPFWDGDNRSFSPNFDLYSESERELQESMKQLEAEQKLRHMLEAELSDIKIGAQQRQRQHDKEILSINEEIERLTKDIDLKRKEIEKLKGSNARLDEEVNTFSAELFKSKEQIMSYEDRHRDDREHIKELSSDTARLIQQNNDANLRIDMLSADLKKVIEDRDIALVEKDSIQKRAIAAADMGRQVKQLQEQLKDRDVEIERLKAECERRTQDLENLTNNTINAPGMTFSNTGGIRSGLLSDELDNLPGDESQNSENDDEEDEEIITTVKRTTRKLKRSNTKTGDIINKTRSDIESDLDSSVVQKETSDRGVQTKVEVHDMSTSSDDIISALTNAAAQTEVTVDGSESLEEHFANFRLEASKILDKDIMRKLEAAEALAREREFTSQQFDQLAKDVGMQTEVIEKLMLILKANVQNKMRQQQHQFRDPKDSLNYACVWTWKYIKHQLHINLVSHFPHVKHDKGKLRALQKELLSSAPPSMASMTTLASLALLFLILVSVTFDYAQSINKHEASWRKANNLEYWADEQPLFHTFGMKSLKYIKYEMQKRSGASRKVSL